MNNLFRLIVGILGLIITSYPVSAAFSSLYVFGDGICTTTTNAFAGSYPFYGQRQSNGRVWVEVLAQRQGLGANSITNAEWSFSSNNCSYYGQYSPLLVSALNQYVPPRDVSTALFIVWVNDADFVADMANVYPSLDMARWTNAMNQSLANHYNIATNLYAKGVRTLIMPSAVDITEIPAYDSLILSAPATRNFIRQRIIDFNSSLTVTLNRARTNCPGLVVYQPDFFSLLDNMLTNAAAYGLNNALYNGVSIDAMEDPNLKNKAINGPGTNYIFWDSTDPTAKSHEVMAELVQQLISSVTIVQLTPSGCSNLLTVANLPVGLAGYVDGCTNPAAPNWTVVQTIASTASVQSVFVPGTNTLQIVTQAQVKPADDGPPMPPGGGSGAASWVSDQQYFRARFPYSWCWP